MTEGVDRRESGRLDAAAALCGVLAGVVGVLVLAGWLFDISWLRSVLPGTVSMKANTALAFMLAGASLALLARPAARRGRVQAGRALALAVIVIGGLTLAEYLWGWNLAIDGLLFKDTTTAVATVIPGRMALSSALSFVLVGLALLMSDLEPRPGFRPAEWLGAGIGLISVVRSAFGYEILYSLHQYPRMPVSSAAAFIMLSVGVMLSRPATGVVGAIRARMTGRTERRVFAALLLGFLVLLVLGIGSFFNAQESVARSEATFRCTEVRRELAMLLSTLQDVEAGARGYVITGEEGYLESYHDAVEALDPRRYAAFESHLEGMEQAEQAERFRRLEPAIRAQIEIAERVVEARRTKGFDEAARLMSSGEGERLMDSIRTAVRRMDQEETLSLDLHQREGSASVVRMNLIIVISTLVGLAIIVLAIVVVHRGLVLSQREGEALEEVNEELKAQAAAREKAEKDLDRLFDSSIDMMCIASLDGYFIELNPAWEKTLGWTDEELKARPYMDFVHPDDVEATTNTAVDLTDARSVFRFENRYLCKDGSYRWFAWNSFPVVAEGVTYAVARDVTAAKAVEAQIARLNAGLQSRAQQLEAANKELEAFTYSVSHDLRAPLRSIDGFSLALAEDYAPQLDDTAKDYIGRVRAATQRMGELIDDLLALSRVTWAELRWQDTDLSQAARDIAADLAKSDPGRKVEFAIAEGVTASADPKLIRTVLENLLHNAWKFTAHHDSAGIGFGVEQQEGEQVFFVKDDGAGFDMAFVDKLFGVFQRLHHTSEFPGTGIGLARVARIVHRHGGRVWAKGEVEKGAAFYFTLGPDGSAGEE